MIDKEDEKFKRLVEILNRLDEPVYDGSQDMFGQFNGRLRTNEEKAEALMRAGISLPWGKDRFIGEVHGYTCMICSWGRDKPSSYAEYRSHMMEVHPDRCIINGPEALALHRNPHKGCVLR